MERWSQAMPSRRAVLALGSATALTAGLPHLAKAQARVADDPAMIAAAKQEGRVTVYANSDQAVTDRLLAFFTDKYGIAIDLQRLAATALAQRFTVEYETNKHVADLYVTTDPLFAAQALAKGWMVKVDNLPAMAAWPPAAVQRGPAVLSMSPFVLAWNTTMAPGRLTSIEALNDPRFKGRVVVNDPRALPASRPWYLAVLQKYGEGFLKELGSHAAMAPNAATAMQHLVSGLMGIYAPAVLPSVNEAIQSGATLNFAILDPVVVNKTVAAIPAKAPHPAAARLLLNYWMSVEGQEVFSRRSYTLMPGVLGTSVLPSYVDVDAEAGERELGRINALLGIG